MKTRRSKNEMAGGDALSRDFTGVSQDVSITAVFSGHYVKTQQTEKTGEDFEFRLRGNTGLNGETILIRIKAAA